MNKRKISLILGVILAVILSRMIIGEPCTVPTPSMEPTILVGDWLWLDKTAYGGKTPRRFGDIPIINVFTWIPKLKELDKNINWGDHRFFGEGNPDIGHIVVFYNPKNKDELYVKRIDSIIHKGDSIAINDLNNLLIRELATKDGKSIDEIEDYSLTDTTATKKQYYKVENEYYFMKGDNDKESLDSRDYGYIKKKDIIGRINTILFSTFNDEDDNRTYFRKGRFFIPAKELNSSF